MINYRNGMSVLTPDGKQVGHVKTLVLTPHTNQVTHLVIGRGFLFTEEKVMPASWISHNDGDKLILNTDQTKFDQLPNFMEREYIPAPTDTREPAVKYDELVANSPVNPSSLYYLGVPGFAPATSALTAIGGPIYISRETRNIPENGMVLDVGGHVLTRDGKHVGNIEQVITSDQGIVTHFIVSEGLLFKTHKLVPAYWIDHVQDKDIHLVVGTEALHTLPDYTQV